MYKGTKLVVGLGLFAVLAVAALYVMDRSAGTHTDMAHNALVAEAGRVLGGAAQALPIQPDYNADGVTETVFVVQTATRPVDGLLPGCVSIRRAVVLQVVKRKPTVLLQVTEQSIQDGLGNRLIPQRAAPEGYCIAFNTTGAHPTVALTMLGGSDIALLGWDASKQAFVWQPHPHE